MSPKISYRVIGFGVISQLRRGCSVRAGGHCCGDGEITSSALPRFLHRTLRLTNDYERLRFRAACSVESTYATA